MFQSALNPNKYLSVMHGNDLNGENIIIEGFASDGPDYWKTRYEFRIENYDDSGKFIISTNCSSNLKVLDVASDIPVHNGLDNRNPIIQYNKNKLPSDNQLWLFEKVPVTSSDGSSGSSGGIRSGDPTPPATSYSNILTQLLNINLISNSDIKSTNDNFYICTKSVAQIMANASVNTLYNGTTDLGVQNYLDDQYLYVIDNGNNNVCGLYKMREQEYDGFDGDDPGVSISFVGFDAYKLIKCINYNTQTNQNSLWDEIQRVVSEPGIKYNSVMKDYFCNPGILASYLIAETYIEFIASTAVNGIISYPNNYQYILDQISLLEEELKGYDPRYNDEYYDTLGKIERLKRLPIAIETNNSKSSNSIIINNQIHLNSPTNLTIYEKYIILSTHTANVTFNSFAAEVKFHSDYLWMYGIPDPIGTYNRALRADMGIGEEIESGAFDPYYDLNSKIVQQQKIIHGEY